jgi:hypothetical protein
MLQRDANTTGNYNKFSYLSGTIQKLTVAHVVKRI